MDNPNLPPLTAAEPATSLLVKASYRELCELALFPVSTGTPLVVLVGWTHELMPDFTLSEIQELDVRVFGKGKTVRYALGISSFRSTIKQVLIDVDLAKAHVYRLNTSFCRAAPVIFVFKDLGKRILEDIGNKLLRAAIAAAQLGDWRLDHGIEWVTAEAVALGGELRPTTEHDLPDAFVWRLDGPLFRRGGTKPLMSWSLMMERTLDDPDVSPITTVITDYDGEVQRASDKFVLKNLRAQGPARGKNRVVVPQPAPRLEERALIEEPVVPVEEDIDENEHRTVRKFQKPSLSARSA